MSTSLNHLLDRFTNVDVIVIGDAMLDTYLEGTTRRFCQEAPVPIVQQHCRIDLPGGAANTAANLAELGARVHLVSVMGDDDAGRKLNAVLQRRGLDTSHILTLSDRCTLHKQRIVGSDQIMLRLDSGAHGAIDEGAEDAVIARLRQLYASCAAVVVSDYGYGVLTPRIVRALADLQTRWRPVLSLTRVGLASFATLARPQ